MTRTLLTLLALWAPWMASAEIRWVRPIGGVIPGGTVVLDRNAGATAILCRARLPDGNLHPGASRAGSCEIPQKGRVERTADFEIAISGNPVWIRHDWASAAIVGRQGRSDLYLCRAPVRVGATVVGWAFGKAYREGPHAGHCYVAYQDREIEAGREFEVFQIDPK